MLQINAMRVLLLILALTTLAQSDTEKLWFELGVKSQNAFFKYNLSSVECNGAIDPTFFEDDLCALEDVLKRMTEEGSLVQHVFSLGIYREIGNEGFQKINRFALSLGKKYGCYTAFEMLDLGVAYRLKTFSEKEKVRLKVRLPKSDMVAFRKLLNTLRGGAGPTQKKTRGQDN